MARPFQVLRARLIEHGYESRDLAKELERCESYVSNRMMARFPWNLDEMAIIMELIENRGKTCTKSSQLEVETQNDHAGYGHLVGHSRPAGCWLRHGPVFGMWMARKWGRRGNARM